MCQASRRFGLKVLFMFFFFSEVEFMRNSVSSTKVPASTTTKSPARQKKIKKTPQKGKRVLTHAESYKNSEGKINTKYVDGVYK